MKYSKCELFGLNSKKRLKEKLGIKDLRIFTNTNVQKHIRPYFVRQENHTKRLVEEPSYRLKIIQKKILLYLQKLDYPEYLFSGIKNKDYIKNAQVHLGKKFVFKIDLAKFFPNTSRNKVYHFFLKKLKTSPDVAQILTYFTTIDLKQYHGSNNYEEICNYLRENRIKQKAHLITGAPTSVLLSYLVNVEMFEQMEHLCMQEKIVMSIFVDDLVFSSVTEISEKTRKQICAVIAKFGYIISDRKMKYYLNDQPKIVTGVVIDRNGNLRTRNSLIKKVHDQTKLLKCGKMTATEICRLAGYVEASNRIDHHFPYLKEKIDRINKSDLINRQSISFKRHFRKDKH